jgi:uncharacterized protein (TIGR02302 family)
LSKGHGRSWQTPSLPGAVQRRLRLTWLALAWEKLWPAFWEFSAVAGLLLALALLDLLPLLPGWLHALALAAALGGLGITLWRGFARVALPDHEETRRRLEIDSGLTHRPLAGLEDAQAAGTADRDSVALWQAHRRRLGAELAKLRVGWPRSRLAAADPYALRSLVVLLLFIGLVVGHGDWTRRLTRAVSPAFASASALPPSLDVWVNPPAYTGMAPLFLNPAQAEALRLPQGSELLVQVLGGEKPPFLMVDETRVDFKEMALESYKLKHTITAGDSLSIQQAGKALATWPLTVIADRAPNIVFAEPPSRTERASLRLAYEADDDYGLTGLGAAIRRIDDPEAPPIELEIILPGSGLKDSRGNSYHDLTAHAWAGIAVEIELTARDALGQVGRSEPFRSVLPERIFNHPVARALVEIRKRLTLAPEERLPVVQDLGAIADRPDHYFHDIVVALALFTASRRLMNDSSPEAVAQVQQLLWDTALRIEEGELAIAERDLREIQKALMEALAEGANEDELERLMDELQAAMDNFLEALAEQMRQQMAEGAEMEQLPPDAQILQREDLRELIEKARELAKSGARDAARDLLARLQEMLENLKAQPFANAMNEDLQDAHKMMRDLENMMQRQQELLDRSFERSRRRQGDEDAQAQMRGQNQEDSQAQEALRRQLGELMRELGDALGDIPQPLGRAEREMRDARGALERDLPGEAVQPQTRSIDQLQQGMQAMADRFLEMFGAEPDSGSGNVGTRSGQGRDPLGRSSGMGFRDAIEGVKIPEEMELRRSRDILDELRRRRGERHRPSNELQYLDRLLRQF